MLSMQTLPSSSLPRQCICVLPGWTNWPCCISCQTGGRIGFLLAAFMWLCVQVGQRWQRLLSARSVTLVGRCSRCTLFGLTLAFWANFWLCACVWETDRKRESVLWWPARELQGQDGNGSKLYTIYDVMAKLLWSTYAHAGEAQYSSELMMHTFTLTHGKVSRCHLRGFACAKQSDMARFVLLIQYSPALCCSITSTSVVLCLVRGRPCSGGIRMCQMKCCGYLSHNCDESGNTLLLYIG